MQTAGFLSEARYLISKEERKELLALPEAEQAKAIERFWKRRDTDPGTPTNEFKDEYLRRIRVANELFTGEPRPGWLTERGRITIVYGEPARRERQPPRRERPRRARRPGTMMIFRSFLRIRTAAAPSSWQPVT